MISGRGRGAWLLLKKQAGKPSELRAERKVRRGRSTEVEKEAEN
jgi:hypothetical protein